MDRIISWNVRGINKRHKQEEVKKLIFAMKVGLVGLLETKVQAHNLGSVYVNMFVGWCFSTNNAWHKGGRIMVSWNPGMFTVNSRLCTSQVMHLDVVSLAGKEQFLVTYIYAMNDELGRAILWADLKGITDKVTGPWLLLGGFNDILSLEERIGGNKRQRCSGEFKTCVDYCKVEDVKYTGSFFIWNNKQNLDTRVYSKLDRVLANQQWEETIQIFQNEATSSRFYNKVGKDLVDQGWGAPMFQLVQKLKRVKVFLKELNSSEFGDIQALYARSYQVLLDSQADLIQNPLDPELLSKEIEAQSIYTDIKAKYLSFLQQKAKLHWMKYGDDNTSFFHNSIQLRRNVNMIYSIKDMDGVWIDKPNKVTNAFLKFYHILLGSKMEGRKYVLPQIFNQGPKVTAAHNCILTTEFSNAEVKAAMFGIPGTKSPGTDGFSKCLESVKDFRSIACCNVVYKVATKLVCSRLRKVLPDLIAQNQSGFVQGRHYGRGNSKPKCMIELDLQKAYDTIEWEFIEEVLQKEDYGRGIHYLLFYDVLLFCHDDFKLIHLMLKGLKLFSQTSGLQPSALKSAMYCSNMD
ncbi:uncharacterized protein LOC133779009 [Humulus lupulus]|uniref:uncharacterized protein LOC133779009 n=1 Tax=Humulus lupulus TaxID=3486 RepID=UPI002B40B368|nr:uncharacterized protein LOC133779009 [Humulus lupulus]